MRIAWRGGACGAAAVTALAVIVPAHGQGSAPNRTQPSAQVVALSDADRWPEAYQLVSDELARYEKVPRTPDDCLDLMLSASVLANRAGDEKTGFVLAQRTLDNRERL